MIRYLKLVGLAATILLFACENEEGTPDSDGPMELTGEVTSDLVLEDLFEGPSADYYVTSKWYLKSNVTINPGVNIMMKPEASIVVSPEGSLNASGTEEKPITIFGEQASKGYWAELTFDNSNQDANTLKHVFITDGGGGFGKGMVALKGNAKAAISNCVFGNSDKYGLYLVNVDSELPEFRNNTITDCKDYPVFLYTNQLHFLDSTLHFENGDNSFVEVDGSELTENATWKKLSGSVLISGAYHYISGDLSVEPGAYFVMGPESKITVKAEGSLNMTGLPEEHITFTAKAESPGYYEGIGFEDSNNPLNEFQYVDISFGGGGYFGAEVFITGSTPVTIGNSSFNSSAQHGIYVSRYSTLTDEGNNSFSNIAGENIFVQQ